MKYRIRKGSMMWGYTDISSLYHVRGAQWFELESQRTVTYDEKEKVDTLEEGFIGFEIPINERGTNFVMFKKEDVEEI